MMPVSAPQFVFFPSGRTEDAPVIQLLSTLVVLLMRLEKTGAAVDHSWQRTITFSPQALYTAEL